MDDKDLECILAAIIAGALVPGTGGTTTVAGAVDRYRAVLTELHKTGGARAMQTPRT